MSRVPHYSGAFLIKDAKILASSRVVRLASVLVEFRSAAFVLRDASPVHIQIARVAAAASVTVLAGTLIKLRGTRQILRHAVAAFVHRAQFLQPRAMPPSHALWSSLTASASSFGTPTPFVYIAPRLAHPSRLPSSHPR